MKNAIEIDGSKLTYEVTGAGPALVLVHAGIFDRGMWDEQVDIFAQRYRVIRYDMRGYGDSSPLQAPVSRRDELYRLLQHLGVERAILIGCSLGGEVVIDFTLEHPQMVAALIAVSTAPGGFAMQGEPPADLMEMIEAMQQGDVARASAAQLRLFIDGPYRQPGEVDGAMRQRAAQMNANVVRSGTWMMFDAQPATPLFPPAVEQLSRIKAPTLLIAGALDNSELVRAADYMATAIPDAQKIVMPGCAHVPNMEKAAEFNRIVLEFLGRVA